MSRIALLLSIAIILLTHFCYYPKWEKTRTEATLSWDVSGYYMYLPATFIYKDLKKCQFKDDIISKYSPTFDFQQAFIHKESGNYVMKYAIGQSIIFSPFFAIAHVWASSDSQYPADGFSFPYQFLISLCALILAIIGLIFLRKSLLYYFEDKAVGFTILGLVVGSNYLNYAAIDGAMTHNSLFTIYAILTYLSIQFYKKPTFLISLGIGLCIGFAALIRPTEIISCLIPLLWGLKWRDSQSIIERINLFKAHWSKIILVILLTILVGSIQLMYWKYATGDWIVYSYQDQGFSWLSPHLIDGVFSYKSGWLIYSPFMVFSLLGFIFLYPIHGKKIFFAPLVFICIFIYIAFAWDIWWYGGSLGQRTMVQAYPLLAFPLCAFINWILRSTKFKKVLFGLIAGIFIYANLWFTHQAHRGGLLHVGQMTKSYFWNTLFTYDKNSESLKLLDGVKRLYSGDLIDKKVVFHDASYHEVLNMEHQNSRVVSVSADDLVSSYRWFRVSIDASIMQKEWNIWTMTQFIVNVKNHDKVISHNMYRIQRHLSDNQTKRIFLDVRVPRELFTDIEIKFTNSGGHKQIDLKNLRVESIAKK